MRIASDTAGDRLRRDVSLNPTVMKALTVPSRVRRPTMHQRATMCRKVVISEGPRRMTYFPSMPATFVAAALSAGA